MIPLPPPPVALDIPALICSVPWPCDQALLVVYGPTPRCRWGESGGDPDAVSPDGENLGLFQLNRVHGGDELLDPATNVAVAYQLWLDQGWAPWSCRPDGGGW